MQWSQGRESSNVEDRRGSGGGFGGPVMIGGAGGVGVIVLALVAMFFGIDPSVILNGAGVQTSGYEQPQGGPSNASPQESEREHFVRYVLGDLEDTWTAIFREGGSTYQAPTLVLFSDAVQSACGTAQAATGPFYCPGDEKVYLDMSFFDELAQRFGAPGDFAQAYVIAHEVGHHVQKLLGITDKVERYRQGQQANQVSVMLELQADCFAGVWANHAEAARHILEKGDLEEGLAAAASVGDDRIQRETRGRVSPDSFTHGSSQQRVRWFKQGLQTGRIGDCNTFNAASL